MIRQCPPDEPGLHQSRSPGCENRCSNGGDGVGLHAREMQRRHRDNQEQRPQDVGRDEACDHPAVCAANPVMDVGKRDHRDAEDRKRERDNVMVREQVLRQIQQAGGKQSEPGAECNRDIAAVGQQAAFEIVLLQFAVLRDKADRAEIETEV
jgi:hypothetical protein